MLAAPFSTDPSRSVGRRVKNAIRKHDYGKHTSTGLGLVPVGLLYYAARRSTSFLQGRSIDEFEYKGRVKLKKAKRRMKA